MRGCPRQGQRNQRVTNLPACLWHCLFNSLRPKRNRRHLADNIFKCIFLNENVLLAIKISLEFIPIESISALGQIMAWHRPGASHYLNLCCVVYSRIHASLGLNELMVVLRYVHCVTRFEWTWIYRNCRRFTICLLMYWCLLDRSVWCILMSNTHLDVILWSVCNFYAYCTTYYIALLICPTLTLGSKCT